MTSRFEITSMILTSCQTLSVRHQPVPNVALSSPHISGYRMLLSRVVAAHPSSAGPFPKEKTQKQTLRVVPRYWGLRTKGVRNPLPPS